MMLLTLILPDTRWMLYAFHEAASATSAISTAQLPAAAAFISITAFAIRQLRLRQACLFTLPFAMIASEVIDAEHTPAVLMPRHAMMPPLRQRELPRHAAAASFLSP